MLYCHMVKKKSFYIFNFLSRFPYLVLEHEEFPVLLNTTHEHHFNNCIICHHVNVLYFS